MQHNGFEPQVGGRLFGNGVLAKKFIDAILTSKRFYAAIAGLLVTAAAQYGMDETLAMSIVATVASWIVSDAVRPTENVFASRRFWAVIASIVASVAAKYGFAVDSESLVGLVMPFVAWILGDGIRETLSGMPKRMQLRERK